MLTLPINRIYENATEEMVMFTVEAKDEFGWFDYDTFATQDEAIRCAREIQPSFNGNVKVIDVENQAEINGE